MLTGTSLGAGVVPDGTATATAPTVTVGANGRITVGITNAVGGVSTNTYRDFNIPRAGVDLDNRAVLARTILNQVTSTNPSLLEGPLNVLGNRANVILANPNGITVNGMTVQNIGKLALTTGQVDLTTLNNPAAQSNITIKTSRGLLEIGPEGLSGELLQLELIAKQIRIGGRIENRYSNPTANLRVVAGTSAAEVNTSPSATDNRTDWIKYTAPEDIRRQGIAVDITGAGSLVSGRIELLVTDQGAGVRHAGSAYATSGDFVVSGTGDLQLASGKIRALQDALIATGGFTGTGDVDAGRHLQATSDRVDLNASTLAAGIQTTGDLVIGVAGQAHSQAVKLTGSVLSATGGIGLLDAGAGISLAGTQASAAGNVVIAASRFQTTQDGKRTALASHNGTLTIQATTATLSDTDADGVAGTSIQARDLALQDTAIRASGAAVAIDATGSYVQRDSSVLAATDVRLHAGSVLLDSAAAQSTLVATKGGVLLQSDGELTSRGALIQGQSRIAGQAQSAGAVTVLAGGSVLNTSTPEYLGIFFGAGDDVTVRAGGDVVNRYGRMLSNGYLAVTAGGDLRNEITKQAGTNGEQPSYRAGSGHRWLVLTKTSARFDVDYGQVDRPAQIAYLLSDKGTTLTGRNVINTGGEIYANNGDIKVRAADTFRTEGITSGAAHYARNCMIVCRTSASSTTTVTGGLLSAGGSIDIQAGKLAANVGGRVLALGDLTVNAPVTYATGVTGYSAIARDRGFKAFFGDTWARLYATDIGGSWMAAGRTRVTGNALIDGGSFDGDVAIAGGTTVTRPRQRVPVTVENHLGLPSWWWQ
ncbi:filamentous hemagglutinin [Cupriavidus basilensis OR16]|uniref:Filamentous hemagglutinin n=1 Tax=Cupriavidus basilensis OR16 TaxID=1127483 RepID=H1SD16_9BURK|nr:filamentous hemagglutinin N-terminal domain-containing protein [Cupriavidus basilensis]EHP39562.1 filamentous hemagglutinin [Cupriavidus basilensis OR16]